MMTRLVLYLTVTISTMCVADSVVVFNEIMYHPATDEAELEWIEFYNQMAVDVDMSGWSVRGGIKYAFPEGTVIRGGGFVILALSPAAFDAEYSYTGAYGPFDGRLSNSGEALILRNNSDRVMDAVDYSDDGDWPAASDGSGASLSKIDLNMSGEPVENWRASCEVGGTPGQANFSGTNVYLAFNEIAAAGTSPYAIEVINMGQQVLDLTGYRILLKGAADDEYVIASGILNPSEVLGFYPDFITSACDKLFLYAPDGQIVLDGVSIESNAKARRPAEIEFRAIPGTTAPTSSEGTLITPTVAAVSSENVLGLDRDANHTVDGSGLTGDGSTGSTHAWGEESIVWTTFGIYGATDYDPYITYDLGGVCDVGTMRIWNYNGNAGSARTYWITVIGPDDVNVYTSVDGVNFTFAETVHFAEAPAASGYTGQAISVDYRGVRYIKFDIMTNHDGAIFNGTGIYPGFRDGRSLTGLSEVRFERSSPKANNPSPYDGKKSISVDEQLSWHAPTTFTPTGYDVHVDTDEARVAAGEPGCAYVSTNQSETAFTPNPDLLGGTTYYWRVKSLGDPSNNYGDVWEFTTMPIVIVHGRWHYPDQPTIGLPNSFAFHDEIVINEIMYHASPAVEPASSVSTVTFVSPDAASRTQIPANGTTGLSWTGGSEPFDDSLWIDGITGIGYETDIGGGPYQSLIKTDVRTHMYGANPSAYIRLPFEVVDPTLVQELMLKMKYDDGFIAYINGREVARVNFHSQSNPEWNSKSSDSHLDTIAVVYEYYDITAHIGSLVSGTNILAIHGLNWNSTNPDFLILPELQAQIADTVEASPSAGSWIELFNRADHSVDISGWRMTDAIEYEFPPGTTIEPGGYIVVAQDLAALKEKYPTISILGDFAGNLSNNNERILLIDGNGNIADEVHYYDGGRWPEYPDGYWASLELRDPFADNSKPQVWSASDESDKTPWQTITYRGVASQSYSPTLWNEFVLGMLGAGEILLDDISVIEDPDGSAIQVIQNGSFESQTTEKWRIIGNHRHTSVVEDPVNPGNHVLKLVSSDPMDYRHNHAETTFAGNRSIVDGREYQISFKAKWIAGSNQLNARLYYARLAKTILLQTPQLQGTPGSLNSCYQANVGPTFTEFGHSPVVPEPGRQVIVTAKVEDPDGVNSCTLWWAVDGLNRKSQLMSPLGDGAYTGSIPPQAASTVVQFYVQAEDSLQVSSTYPSRAADSRALYKVQDGQASLSGMHNIRAIMTSADTDFLFINTNLMSNDRLGATVIYDEKEVYYDVGVRLKGSVAARARDGDGYIGYSIRFNNDRPFRGVHRSVSIDRSGRSPVVRGQDEIYIKHMFNRADVPCMYDDLAHFIAPKSIHTGSALMMMARYENIFLESQWKNGDDGTVYNLDITYHPTSTIDGNPESLKPAMPEGSTGPDLVYLGEDKESYRSPYQIKSNRRGDDYDGLIEFCKTMSLPQDEFEDRISEVMDVDEWMRCTALANLCGLRDNYLTSSSWGFYHNIRLYCRPEDRKIVALPWDMDFVFDLPYTSPLWPQTGFSLQRVIELTGNKRLYYGHLKDLIETTFNTSYMDYWLASYSALLPGQNFTGRSSYILNRSNYVKGRLPVQVSFAIADSDFIVDMDYAAINGQAWIDVKEIHVEGIDEPLEPAWTSTGSGTSELFYWQVHVPVDPGENILNFLAYDFQGNLIASDSITVTSTRIARPLRDHLRITELMYDPAGGSAYEFVELCNTGPNSLDLTYVTFSDGIEFAFADSGVTSLSPGEYVVIVKDVTAFASRYADGVNVADWYSGKLNNDGEKIEILGRYNAQILAFDYSDKRGWPLAADGPGHSLVPLADAIAGQNDGSLDYGGNWRASTYIGGSPGAPDPKPPITIVLNEVMAHTDLNDPAHPDHDSNDWVELYNPTDSDLVTGPNQWFLSDDKDILTKWAIPEMIIPANGWVSFDEITGFHQNPLSPEGFGLDKAGEMVLLSYLPGTSEDRVIDCVRFKGQENDLSLGRYPDGSDYWYTMPLSRNSTNADPSPHVVISEIMYHPFADELEYVELYNPTSEMIPLWDTETAAGWRFTGGVDFSFPTGSILPAGGRLLVVGFDPNEANLLEFEDMYGSVPAGILGPYSGKLSNGGERLALKKPQASDLPGGDLSWVIVDEVIYFDRYPWPAEADGQGRALQRSDMTLCGRDPSAWSLAVPKPGISPADFDRDGNVDLKDMAIFCRAWRTFYDGPYWNPACDISNPPNDSIDIFDLLTFSREWLDGP